MRPGDLGKVFWGKKKNVTKLDFLVFRHSPSPHWTWDDLVPATLLPKLLMNQSVVWEGTTAMGCLSIFFQGYSREGSAHLQEWVADSRYAVFCGASCHHQSPEGVHQPGYHLE